MSYLENKSGSMSEVVKEMQKHLKDNAYQDLFKKELEKTGKGIGAMSDMEKKDFFNKLDKKYKAKDEETVNESASQVQVKRDGKGNFNLMFRGKEIGYYHKSGSKYMVYYDNEDGDYNQSDEVSSEMQAKKLAYDNMNEKVDKKESVDGVINQKKHDSYNDPKKGEKKPVVTQEEESFDIEKLKEDVNTLWSTAGDDLEAIKEKAKYMKAQDKDASTNEPESGESDDESEKQKKGKTLVGSAKTKVETEPKVDYQK